MASTVHLEILRVHDDQLEETVGADLARLVRMRPVPLTAITPISASPSAVRGTGAFRFDFADRTTLKGRRLFSPERAEEVERLVKVAGEGFKPVLVREGAAILVDWVDGSVLTSMVPIAPELAERCGRMLSRLHRLDIPDWHKGDVRQPDRTLSWMRRSIDTLVSAGEIESRVADRASRTATALRPDHASVGILHYDFCPENLVLDESGTLFSIDDATIRIGPHDLDLARTWLRWRMTRDEGAAFLRGYQEGRTADGFLQHFSFWAICALVGSAAIRVRGRQGGVRMRVQQLEEVLEGSGDGATRRTVWPASGASQPVEGRDER